MANPSRLYNGIRTALKRKKFSQAKELAEELAAWFKDSMSSFGWEKIPLTGEEEVDNVLKSLDPYLTGDRSGSSILE
jgi:hypothetical protein